MAVACSDNVALGVEAAAEMVCIKVLKPRTPARATYEALSKSQDLRLQEWFHECVSTNSVYVGRPKCDGGWYQAPEVKKGSIFANPLPLKEYSLRESLARFTAYIEARMNPEATVESIIAYFPEKLQPWLLLRFVEMRH